MSGKLFVKCIGWFVLAVSVLSLYLEYGVPFPRPEQHGLLMLLNISSACAMFPRAYSALLIQKLTHLDTHILKQCILVWRMVVMLCAIGILRSNNTARKILIVLCIIQIVVVLPVAIPIILSACRHMNWSGAASYLFQFIPVVYVGFLMLPSIKQHFKQDKKER